jgi:hypothetical protein
MNGPQEIGMYSVPERAKLKAKLPMEKTVIDINYNLWRWVVSDEGLHWFWIGSCFHEN